MAEWIRLCAAEDAPAEGGLSAVEVAGRTICLSRVRGDLHAMDGICPHRGAPLAEGWIEDGKVVCPWHSWEFDCVSGQAAYPEGEHVAVFPVKTILDEIMAEL